MFSATQELAKQVLKKNETHYSTLEKQMENLEKQMENLQKQMENLLGQKAAREKDELGRKKVKKHF